MTVIEMLLVAAALPILYRLSLWAAPIAAAWAAGSYASTLGSGWLLALAAGFAAACAALALIRLGLASRTPALRGLALIAALVPTAWAGGFALRALAMQTGAEGTIWPALATAGGALLFAGLASMRLGGSFPQRTVAG